MQAQALNTETCLDKPDGMAADPIYRQVALLLEQDIRSHLKPGDLLASETKLASRFNVNRHTVRRSIDQLVRAGLVVKQQGRGTQVVSNQIEYLLNPAGKFTKNLTEKGKSSQALLLATRSYTVATVPAGIGRIFARQYPAGGTLMELQTLRFMEQVPVCLIHHYVWAQALPGIATSYSGGSLHRHIENHYQRTLQRSQIQFSAVLATNRQAIHLKCAVDSPLAIVQSVNHDQQSRTLVEVSVSYSRPDRLQYQIDFNTTEVS
jgi:GntR family phosphonate transport system transcriptional regulator